MVEYLCILITRQIVGNKCLVFSRTVGEAREFVCES